jgi:hypothetical protein|tara:strand:- start:377 stop:562 length:186 start_codon:yes stop_codon:yes gene_type:complete
MLYTFTIEFKTNDMKTYRILNNLQETIKAVTVNSLEEVQDIKWDLENYHSMFNLFTIEEVK